MTREQHLSNRWFSAGAATGLFAGWATATNPEPIWVTGIGILLVWNTLAALWWWLRRAPNLPREGAKSTADPFVLCVRCGGWRGKCACRRYPEVTET